MATAALQLPPSNHILPGSCHLRTPSFPIVEELRGPNLTLSAESIAAEWATDFNQFLNGKDLSATDVFLSESWWRDLLCTTWDFRTLQGLENIDKFTKASITKVNVTVHGFSAHKTPRFATIGALNVVQAFLKVDTTSGKGQGLVRLVFDSTGNGKWKAFTLFTALEELKGHEENVHSRRPTGVLDDRMNWKDRLSAQQNFEGGREPTVLILGVPSIR